MDGAIHRAGGPAILDECRAIRNRQGGCATGEAVITTAGKLPARFVIHTVGPVWQGGQVGEEALLAAAYQNSLQRAAENNCRTVAFPSISTGIYGYPKVVAAQTAVAAVREFVAEHPAAFDRIVFVCFDEENLRLYQQLLASAN